VRHGGISPQRPVHRDPASATPATLHGSPRVLADQFADLQSVEAATATDHRLTATLKPEAARRVQEQALKQNMVTLHNRINELGVAEPVIQQQGHRPHRGAAARRAGHGQGQGHPGPHRHPGECGMVDESGEAAPPSSAAARCRSGPSATSSATAVP
jgi:hypothetical protein